MSHTRVLSLKEGNTRAEKRGLDSSVSKREREREREAEKEEEWKMARERKGYLLLAAFNPTLLVRGALKKGEKRRGRGRKRARTRRRRRPNGGSCGCCASSSLWPDIDPSIADQYPKEKLRSRLRRPGRKRYRSHGSSLLAILSDQRDSQANFRVFPPFLSNTLLSSSGSSWCEALIVPAQTARFVNFFVQRRLLGRVEGDSKVWYF